MNRRKAGARQWLSGAALLALLVNGNEAFAQAKPPACSPVERKEASTLADAGLERFEAGDYAAAQERFEQAEVKCHSLQFLLFLARTYGKQGKLLTAERTYQSIVDEALPKTASAALRGTQTSAQSELDEVKKRVGIIEVRSRAALRSVKLDGAAIAAGEMGGRVRVDPGAHVILAEGQGWGPVRRRVTVPEGGTVKVEIEAEAPSAAETPPDEMPAPETPAPRPAPESSVRPSTAVAITSFVIGGLGLGIGTAAGIASLSKVSDIRCEGNHCLREDQSIADSAKTLATTSDVALIVGGIAVAAGATILLVRPKAAPPDAPTTSLSVRVGPGSIGAQLVF